MSGSEGRPGPRRRGWSSWLALALVITGCQEPEGPPPDEVASWTVEEQPTVSIGGLDADPDHAVHNVIAASRLEDGRIVVVAAGSAELKYFDSSGQHVRTAGGQGDGPGEFRRIQAVQHLVGDTLLVLSDGSRLSWFSPGGDFVRSRSVELLGRSSYPCRIGVRDWWLLRDGSPISAFLDNLGIPGCPESPEGIYRQSALLVRQTQDGQRVDSLGLFQGTERNGRNYRVFGTSLVWAVGEEEVYVADSGGSEILRLALSGDTLGVLPTPHDAEPVLEAARSIEARRYRRSDGTEEVGPAYDYPETYPRIARLLVDREGMVWVMAYPKSEVPLEAWLLTDARAPFLVEGRLRWAVLDRDGRRVAEVETPPGVFPLEIGEDYLLGLSRDEYDVQAVGLYRVDRASM